MNGVGVVTKGPLSSDYDYMLYITANSSLVTFYKKNSLGVAESMGFLSSLVNRWVNICFTKQGTAIRSYENATQKTTATFSTSDIRITSNSLKIGNGWSSAYGGNIPIVQIYNRALTATEVLKNYQEQFPRFLGENIVTNGLALYLDAGYGTSYPTTGTTWYDVSGYNNNATLVNGPSFNSGNGGSIVFDGTDDYGFTSATTSLGNSNTVCAFIKLNGLQTNSSGAGLSGGTIYTSTANGVDNYLGISGNKLYLFATEIADVNNFGLIGTTSLDTSNSVWYYVTSVINGNTATIYINGVLEATVTQSFIIASWSGNGFIGCRTTTTRLLKGSIANISVYSRALTQSEILQNFNAQKSRFGL
jgi:hypothetical protein